MDRIWEFPDNDGIQTIEKNELNADLYKGIYKLVLPLQTLFSSSHTSQTPPRAQVAIFSDWNKERRGKRRDIWGISSFKSAGMDRFYLTKLSWRFCHLPPTPSWESLQDRVGLAWALSLWWDPVQQLYLFGHLDTASVPGPLTALWWSEFSPTCIGTDISSLWDWMLDW